ncbi:MAG: thioredoxin domain-containing protein [Candidatus Komeilibacteria bacterium]|nr:thioredoxin domain-containing protein [Candidatus Komeilibacteria bacterium]
MKKYWWILVIPILIIGAWLIFNPKKPGYTELNAGPHLQGNPDASISLVEFSDFQCPACQAAFTMAHDLIANYGDKIKLEYRHFPLPQHSYALGAAVAAECAADQGKFWEYYDLLFPNQAKLTKADLSGYAAQVEGLNADLWQVCAASGVKEKRVKADLAEAIKQGFNSTPTFLLNGQKVEDWSALPGIIQSLLQPAVSLNPAASATSTVK